MPLSNEPLEKLWHIFIDKIILKISALENVSIHSTKSTDLSILLSSQKSSSVSPASSSSLSLSFRSHHEAMEFHYLVLHVG